MPTAKPRRIHRALFDVENVLQAVVVETDTGYHLCEVRGPDAMVDIGPFEAAETAVVTAKFRSEKDLFVFNEEKMGDLNCFMSPRLIDPPGKAYEIIKVFSFHRMRYEIYIRELPIPGTI